LVAVRALKGAGTSIIEKILGANAKPVESYRYASGRTHFDVQEEIKEEREAIKKAGNKKRSMALYMELLPLLVSRDYVMQYTKSAKVSGSTFTKTWSEYRITSKGLSLLDSASLILLPVPPSLREIEEKEDLKHQANLKKLQNCPIAIDISRIPAEEIQHGDFESSEILKTYVHWANYLSGLESAGRLQKLERLRDLKNRIEDWRSACAVRYKMAPASVLSDHLLLKVAYTSASCTRDGKMRVDSLRAAGVRSQGVGGLVEVLAEWVDEDDAPVEVVAEGRPMLLPEEFSPDAPWKHAVYKPSKKTGLAAWESSHDRFMRGEHPQSIAIAPLHSAKPLQVNTIISHLFSAILQGRAVDLHRLAQVSTLPSQKEWMDMEAREEELAWDVADMPPKEFIQGLFLETIMGQEWALKEKEDRTTEEYDKFYRWIGLLRWYTTFRRVGYVPQFGAEENKTRTS